VVGPSRKEENKNRKKFSLDLFSSLVFPWNCHIQLPIKESIQKQIPACLNKDSTSSLQAVLPFEKFLCNSSLSGLPRADNKTYLPPEISGKGDFADMSFNHH
jgi:hypothetical protein